ncbi:MAG: hypothetical protein K0A99_12665 [Desulfoarculaceae bacterium]|nr:hypothetical protein [Desulfoarculaceae bacterium]
MPTLETWGGVSQFSYDGSVETGTKITYGNRRKAVVTAHQYAALRQHFLNREVPIGTTRKTLETEPPEGSLGAWLHANVNKAAIASYVGPILVHEDYAERVGEHGIRITR